MIVTLLCIITTVVLRGVVDKADAEYTEVEVRVVSSDTVYRKILGKLSRDGTAYCRQAL